MSDWGWVALGLGVAYGSIGAYLGMLRARAGRARRRVAELP